MIDLYAAGTSNGIRARIGLEECGLEYKLHPIDLMKGEQRAASFMALNPNGQIPVIVDSEGPGGKPLTLTQSSAILLYCAEKTGKFLPTAGARPAFHEAYMSAASDVGMTLSAIFAIERVKDMHQPTMDAFKAEFRRFLKVWDEKLGRQRHAAGEELTIADFSLYGVVVRVKQRLPDLLQGLSSLTRWLDEIGARPGVQRAMKF